MPKSSPKSKAVGKSATKSNQRKPAKQIARLDVGKEIRAIARERVGTVKAGSIIAEKPHKDPKHKKREQELSRLNLD